MQNRSRLTRLWDIKVQLVNENDLIVSDPGRQRHPRGQAKCFAR
jgi:hypothetical protein